MLTLYDTLTKSTKELQKTDSPVRLFVCGPTVYDYSHIGHARTYIAFDMFVKYLRSRGYTVQYLQNITDLDDKIIERAKETGASPIQLASQFELEYLRDMSDIGVTSVDTYARATDYIPAIIEQIELLIEKEYAYAKPSGVYYRVSKFTDYGKLSGQKQDELREGAGHGNEGEEDKENPEDFVVWKTSKEGEPAWESPWGLGRPGWHIEDTAITKSVFGSAQYEIHGGARDLIFPHHESEIALMEAAYGATPMVGIWMHTGFLNVGGEKMSKSLGNFITIRDILGSYAPETLRMFFATRHYRSALDYTQEGLTEAKASQARLLSFWKRVGDVDTDKPAGDAQPFIDAFWNNLEDDFGTPQALASLFELVSYANKALDKELLGTQEARTILSFLEQMNDIFGLVNKKDLVDEDIPDAVQELAKKREEARAREDWDEADALRKQIQQEGYEVSDSSDGTILRDT